MALDIRNKRAPSNPSSTPTPRPSVTSSNLKAHPTVTPLSCVGTSAVPEGGLAVLEWTLLDGNTQLEAMTLYNKTGYAKSKPVETNDGISYLFRRYGPLWYEEQRVVRPWKLYTKKERKELVQQGLGEGNFPFIHPRDLPNAQPSRLNVFGNSEPNAPSLDGPRHRDSSADMLQGENIPTLAEQSTTPNLISTPLSRKKGLGAPFEKWQSWNTGPPDISDKAHSPVRPTASDKQLVLYVYTTPAPVPGTTQPIPKELKEEILSTHIVWLEANRVAYETGKVELTDLLEVDLERLEKQAMRLNANEFRAWKLGDGGYGTWSSRGGTLISFSGLEVLQVALKGDRKREWNRDKCVLDRSPE